MSKSKVSDSMAVERLLRTHGDRYNYSLVEYTGAKGYIDIICTQHGTFKQRFDHHSNGSHCQICSKETKSVNMSMTTSSFIERSVIVHGDKYSYYPESVLKRRVKVAIFCNSCNTDFYQTTQSHLEGHGCYNCNKGEVIGFKRSKFIEFANRKNNGKAIFYVLRCYNATESFFKVGVTTNSIAERYLSSKMPYNYEVVVSKYLCANTVWSMEKSFIRRNSTNHYLPKNVFSGYKKECFSKLLTLDEWLFKNT